MDARLSLCLVAVAASGLSGCRTPCEALREHAGDCERARGPYAGEASVCEATREALGAESFDAYADCALAAECDDPGAVGRCQEEHFGASLDDCATLTTWASACSLEPQGTENDCEALSRGLLDAVDSSPLQTLVDQLPPELRQQLGDVEGAPQLDRFGSWVACVTAEGCPAWNDPRYELCQDSLVPPQATDLLEACLIYSAWTQACAGHGNFVPINATSLPECLAQAQPFIPSTYLAYAHCLEPVGCDDLTAQLSCLDNLVVSDRQGLQQQCTALLEFANSCQAPLGGGDVDACARIFAPFTRASTQFYVDCVIAGSCAATLSGALDCSALLELQ